MQNIYWKVPISTFYLVLVCHSTKLQVISRTFWKICSIQIKINPETSNEPTYGAFSYNNIDRVHFKFGTMAGKSTLVEKYFLLEICHIQIKIYPQTSIVPKFDVLSPINKVRVPTLSLALWLLLKLKSSIPFWFVLVTSIACTNHTQIIWLEIMFGQPTKKT